MIFYQNQLPYTANLRPRLNRQTQDISKALYKIPSKSMTTPLEKLLISVFSLHKINYFKRPLETNG